MSFIRPEARAALWRWRGVIAGAAVTALGVNLVATAHGLLAWLGWPILLAGLALLVTGLQRARVKPRSGGAGMVDLDEGRLSYFLPEGGAAIALPSVIRIEIETTGAGPFEDDLFWRFTSEEGEQLRIPGSAHGADRLFDALAQFPGADYGRVVAASGSTEQALFLIWQRSRPGRIDTPRLS